MKRVLSLLKTKRSIGVLSGIIVFVLLCLQVDDVQNYLEAERNEQKRIEYEEFLKTHPFTNRGIQTIEEYKSIPKAERPDLAAELNFLQTLDPALGYPPTERLSEAVERVNAFNKNPSFVEDVPGSATGPWVERGPSNVPGRTRAIMWDPNDSNNEKAWAGGVDGGIWFNNDATDPNSPWQKVDDFMGSTIAISSIAYDPTNTMNFYVGTGEGYFHIDAVRGDGIWKSTNGGATWEQLPSTASNNDFRYIQNVAVHPTTGDVYAATRSFSPSTGGGIFRSTNGGTTWTNVLNSSNGAGVSRAADVEIASDGTIYAAMGIFQTDGLYSSATGNAGSWTKLNTGNNGFPTSGFQRIEIALVPSNSNALYVATQAAGSNAVNNILRTNNQGADWTSQSVPSAGSQAWYDLIMRVDPNDDRNAIIGVVTLWRTTDGGGSWSQTGSNVHVDFHGIKYRPGSSTEALVSCDGGIWYSETIGSTNTYARHSRDYHTTQFYACALHPDAGEDYMLGGTQDNGSPQFDGPGVDATIDVSGGDGGFPHINQNNPLIQAAANQFINIHRSTDGGETFSFDFGPGGGLFINPSDYDSNRDILYYSSGSGSSIGRLLNFGTAANLSNNPISGLALGSAASHLHVSPHTVASTTLFVGTQGGSVFRITNANTGASTTTNITGAGFPSGNVSCVEIGGSEDTLLTTFSNYGIASVWYSTDGGASWADKEGDLPDMPVRWALFNPNDSKEVILATEIGTWATSDITAGSPTWTPSNTGLANVRVDMLQMRDSDFEVIAATHGRGMYSSRAFSSIASADADVSPSSFEFDLAPGEMDTGTLTIANIAAAGAQNLNWNINQQPPGFNLSKQPVEREILPKGQRSTKTNPPVTEGTGGPDPLGYTWIDSDEPGGPTFDWVDITGVGTSVSLADDDAIEVMLPFSFPFYGFTKSEVKITSNGYLTFAVPFAFGNNFSIPDPGTPNDVIGGFWTDLDPSVAGTIHYHHDAVDDEFIVQYTDVPQFGQAGNTYTFQIILTPDGKIKVQYFDMSGPLSIATVGIENALGAVGLQVVFNAPYVQNGLATLFQGGPWLSLDPPEGSVSPGSNDEVSLSVDVTDLPSGTYQVELAINTNDPAESQVIVPVTLNVSANEFNQEVLSGWNIIGRPLNVADSSVSTLYPDHEPNSLFSWNGSYQGGSEVARCTGYWLRFPAGATVPINGTSQSSCTINLIQGWNLIAGPSCDVPIANIDDPSGVITGTIFGWGGNYFNATSINQGLGYWVNASGPGTITISCASAASKYQPFRLESAVDMSRLATIDIRDANGHSQSLYFNAALNEGQTLNSFMLPPVSPAGTFDARLAGDYRLTEGDEATIKLQTAHYPVTVDFSNLPLVEGSQYVVREMAGTVELGTHSVSEGQSITISNAQVTTLQLSKIDVVVPQAFALEQNYPNPFNPTTEIRYAIPQAEKVVLTIYNSLGQKVRTLVSEQQEAGLYTVKWDATNDVGAKVSSGIYMYRVTAGSFTAIKKMILMK